MFLTAFERTIERIDIRPRQRARDVTLYSASNAVGMENIPHYIPEGIRGFRVDAVRQLKDLVAK